MSRRPLIVGLILAVLAVLVIVDRDVGRDEVAVAPPPPPTPVVSGPGAPSSAWYCPAGTATGTEEGAAEQTVVLANGADQDTSAVVTILPDEGEPVSRAVEVPASSRVDVVVSELVQAADAAAVVEATGGELVVGHLLEGPTGATAGPCASSVAAEWFVPMGTTVLGVGQRLAVVNPFPDEAVVDITFETETDTRTPPEFQGLVIPARSVRVLDVSATVTVREQVTTRLVSRSGLVAVEQLLVTSEDSDLPTSLVTTLGAPGAAEAWAFPEGIALSEGVDVRFAVYNPGETSAVVDVELLIDDPATNGIVEPYALSVGPRQFQLVDLRQDGRVPEGVGWSAVVRSADGTPVVAGMWVVAGGDASPRGQALTIGTPVLASRWEIPIAGVDETEARVTISNPSATPVTVRVSRVGDGSSEELGSGDGVEIPAGGRVTLAEGSVGDPATGALRVDADGMVAVSWLIDRGDAGFSLAPAIPVEGTLEALSGLSGGDDAIVLEGAPAPQAPPDDTAPDDTAPDDTAPDGDVDESGSAGTEVPDATTAGG